MGQLTAGILDQILPSALPLGLTFLVYYFIKRGVRRAAADRLLLWDLSEV